MFRRSLLLVLPLVPALLLGAPLLHHGKDITPQDTLQDREPANPGGVLLRNAGRDNVEVEIRSGAGGDCTTGRVLATQTVAPGDSWSVRSSQPLCFRRTDPIGPERRARNWERKVTPRGQIEEVVL